MRDRRRPPARAACSAASSFGACDRQDRQQAGRHDAQGLGSAPQNLGNLVEIGRIGQPLPRLVRDQVLVRFLQQAQEGAQGVLEGPAVHRRPVVGDRGFGRRLEDVAAARRQASPKALRLTVTTRDRVLPRSLARSLL